MRAEILEEFNDVLDSIYAASMRPSEWQGCLEKIAHLHRAERAALLTPSTPSCDGGYIVSYNMSGENLRLWGEKYVAQDPWVANAVRRNLIVDGAAFTGEDLVPDAELLPTTFYKEFLTKFDIRYICTGVVFNGAMPELPLTSCTAYRNERMATFGDEARELHGLLLRHLSRALGAMYKLQDLEFKVATSARALDLLPGAVVLMAPQGHVLFANKAARAIFAMDDGLTLRSGHPTRSGMGWIRASTSDAQSKLEQVMKGALTVDPLNAPHFSHAAAIERKSGKKPYLVRACPLADSSDFSDCPQQAAGLLFLTDPEAELQLDSDVVAQLYGLTPAETRVAAELLKGEPLRDVASALGIGEPTVKTHLQNLFGKTGTTRQQQLVRLLMTQCR